MLSSDIATEFCGRGWVINISLSSFKEFKLVKPNLSYEDAFEIYCKNLPLKDNFCTFNSFKIILFVMQILVILFLKNKSPNESVYIMYLINKSLK